MSEELPPFGIHQIFKDKYLAKYVFSIHETLTCDLKYISQYILLVNISFHSYGTAVACKNSHSVSMAYISRTPYNTQKKLLDRLVPVNTEPYQTLPNHTEPKFFGGP